MNERDPKLEEALRAHLREAPPPALDAKILAAAHRAVESGPRKVGPEATRPQRWWMPLAAAAAIGAIAIGIVQQMPKDAAIDTTSVTNAPAVPAPAPAPPPVAKAAPMQEQAAAPASAPPAPPPIAQPSPAEIRPAPARDAPVPAKKQKEAEMSRDAAPVAAPPPPVVAPPPAAAPAPAPSPFPAAPSQPLQKTELASSEAKRDAPREAAKETQMADARKDALAPRPAAAGAAAPAPPSLGAPAAAPPAPVTSSFPARQRSQETAGALAQNNAAVGSDYAQLARDPDAWIVRIRKLRDEGNTAQALRELREFRALVPDAERKLPADLKSLQP